MFLKPAAVHFVIQLPARTCGERNQENMYCQLIIYVSIFLRLISGVSSLNLCQLDQESNVTSYLFRDNGQLENCNCREQNQNRCLRKCCAVGFHMERGECKRNIDDKFVLSVTVYRGQNFLRNTKVHRNISVGVLNCDHFFPIFLNEYVEDDWGFFQEDGTLSTASYGTLYNDNFCLDTVKGTERIVAMVCFQDTPEVVLRRVNLIGTCLTPSVYFIKIITGKSTNVY